MARRLAAVTGAAALAGVVSLWLESMQWLLLLQKQLQGLEQQWIQVALQRAKTGHIEDLRSAVVQQPGSTARWFLISGRV